MDAIVEVVDTNQKTINQPGIGFEGFIPATFGQLVNETFGRSAVNDAEMKGTAPLDLAATGKPGRMNGKPRSLVTSFSRRTGQGASCLQPSPEQGPRRLPRRGAGILRGVLLSSGHGGPKGH